MPHIGQIDDLLWIDAGAPPSPKAVNDPELLAEAKKKTMDVDLITGEEAEALAKEVVNQPPDILVRLKKPLAE